MTEAEKKTGHLKVTVEVDINEGLMDVAKDAIVKSAEQIPEIIRGRRSEDKK